MPQPADASASSSTSAACSAVRAASTLPDCTNSSGTPVASLNPRMTSMLDCARRVSVSSALNQLVETGGARRGLRSRSEPVQDHDPARTMGGKLIADAEPEGSGPDDDGIGLGDGKRILHATSPNERWSSRDFSFRRLPAPVRAQGRRATLSELAAIEGHNIVTGAELTEEAALGIAVEALLDQLPNHGDEDRVGPDRGHANHLHPEVGCSVLRLDVEIEEHFEMVGDEPDRDHDDVFRAGGMQAIQLVENIGIEPRDVRWSAAALPCQPVARGAGEAGHEPADFAQLALVGTAVRHRDRDAMRGKDDLGRVAAISRQRLERVADPMRHRFTNPRWL